MIHSGDKNVNVVDIINKLSGKPYPSGQGIPDGYTTDEPYVEYPRDERERNPLTVIDSDEIKPLDGEDFNTRLKKVENEVEVLSTKDTTEDNKDTKTSE